MRNFLIGSGLVVLLSMQALACPPKGMTRADLFALKTSGFDSVAAERANIVAVELLACLGDPDPKIRDGIVFEAIQHWLRGKTLQVETVRTLHQRLLGFLNGPDDSGGYRRPFAALLLSEVARADRVAPFLTAEQRSELARAASAFMQGITDYRGFDDVHGWRHRVAHTADLVLQLGLNPLTGHDELKQMMQAVFAQVSPKATVFYVYGEPARLFRAVLFVHQRNVLADDEWAALFYSIGGSNPFASWRDVYSSQAGLAKRHNTVAFLNEAYTSSKATGDAKSAELAVLALQTLESLEK